MTTKLPGYGKIYALGHRSLKHLFDTPVVIQEKVDGCFAESVVVHLSDGTKKTIKELVDTKFDGYVRCFDFDTNSYVDGRVLDHFTYPASHKAMVQVEIIGRNETSRCGFRCTEDHEIYTKECGWRNAVDLTCEDHVQTLDERLDYIQLQMILGGILGDASFSRGKTGNPRFTTGHSVKKGEYSQLIRQLLGGLYKTTDIRRGGFPGSGEIERVQSKSTYMFTEMYESFYKGRKSIPEKYLMQHLDTIALAFWYMDDGSCSFSKKQRPRPTFNTQCFTENDHKILQTILATKFGIIANIIGTGKGRILTISADSAEKFFHIIAPYVTTDMKYKLPLNLRLLPCVLQDYKPIINTKYIWQPIKSVKKTTSVKQYDIETEFGNYLVGSLGTLVHNSQFTFGVIDGRLHCRSRGGELDLDSPQALFKPAVETVKHLFLEGKLFPDWVYRGEAICKPKHNTLAYDRAPEAGFILFDIKMENIYADAKALPQLADALGLECVPVLFEGMVSNQEELHALLDTVSMLGGQKIEGFVVKNYHQSIRDEEDNEVVLKGKYVSERFKEVHNKGSGNKGPKTHKPSVIEKIGLRYKTEARWDKAIQHLKERGEYTQSPKDIPALMKEVNADILAECGDELKELLWKESWGKISKIVTEGLPRWYKEKLMSEQFEPETSALEETEKKS